MALIVFAGKLLSDVPVTPRYGTWQDCRPSHHERGGVHGQEKDFCFSWLAPLVWPTAIRASAAALVKTESLITRTVPLRKAGKAIRGLKEREGDPSKAQVKP